MKKIAVAIMGLLYATALVVNAQNATTTTKSKKTKLTAEQQALQKDMLAKYDANKDGKLDKNEKAAISKEDKDKMTKAGLLKASKKNAPAATTGSSTNAPAH
jgi:Skp family chaperone for outer membrane proteins